jgi:hypothetical protein
MCSWQAIEFTPLGMFGSWAVERKFRDILGFGRGVRQNI